MTTLHLRKSIGRAPVRRGLLLIPLLLACFALLPSVQATPDPGVIGGGNSNAADGFGALNATVSGINNSAFGANALHNLTTGNNNAAQGNSALFSNVSGSGNVAIGVLALRLNTDGFQNTAVGGNALNGNISGVRNTALGYSALRSNIGDDNVAIGWQALVSKTTGDQNTAVGVNALASNTIAGANTAIGFQALNQNTSGGNTAVGFQAGFGSMSGEGNTAMGFQALFSGTGGDNTAIGNSALFGNTDGSDNVALGAFAGGNVSTANNVICIGGDVGGENTSDRTYIGNIGAFTQGFSAGVNELVTVNLATGRLGHFNPIPVSSRRYKEDIKSLDKTSEALFSLKPVSYRLKKEFDPTQPLAFGLIAEEVEKVNPDLVYRNNKGQVESVRYEMVNAMMLNEFLKEHQTVQEQKATIAQLKQDFAQQQRQIEALTAGLQKVSAQIEVTKPAPQVVNNP